MQSVWCRPRLGWPSNNPTWGEYWPRLAKQFMFGTQNCHAMTWIYCSPHPSISLYSYSSREASGLELPLTRNHLTYRMIQRDHCSGRLCSFRNDACECQVLIQSLALMVDGSQQSPAPINIEVVYTLYTNSAVALFFPRVLGLIDQIPMGESVQLSTIHPDVWW